MKIAHRIKGVKVVKYDNFAEALIAGLGRYRTDISDMIAALLQESLGNRYEEEGCVYCQCALASLEREMSVHELYEILEDTDYRLADFSESMSYLRLLRKRGVALGSILHLGTFICGEDFREQRFLTKGDGTVKFVNFYPATKLEPSYDIVVVEKEKTNK